MKRSQRSSSTPKRNKNAPQGVLFLIEDGKNYRPFIDPSRIAANDAKKSSTHDARAHVKGVPNEYLGVMPMKTEPINSNEDTLYHAASERRDGFQAARVNSSPSLDELDQSAFSVNTDQSAGNIPSDYPVTDSMHVGTQHHDLHPQTPETIAPLSYQDRLQSASENPPAPQCYSAVPETSLSADQYTFSLPCVPSDQIGNEYDAETCFSGFGRVVDADFTYLYGEPEIDYSFSVGTPESMGSLDSSGSILSNGSPYTPISDHQYEECTILGSRVEQPFDNLIVPQQSSPEHQFLDSIIRERSISIPSCAEGHDFNEFVSQISKVMQLEEKDLQYLNAVIARNCFSPRADPDTIMMAYSGDDPQRELVSGGA